jgi:hypothetical protein
LPLGFLVEEEEVNELCTPATSSKVEFLATPSEKYWRSPIHNRKIILGGKHRRVWPNG